MDKLVNEPHRQKRAFSYKYFFLVCIICVLSLDACSTKEEKSSKTDSKSKLCQKLICYNKTTNKNEMSEFIQCISINKIDFNTIKNKYQNKFTSGILTEPHRDLFYTEKDYVRYGFYFFLDESCYPFSGKAIVANNSNHWYYMDTLDVLLELSIYCNAINPFVDSMMIGDSIFKIINRLGENYIIVKNNFIYDCTNHVKLSFLVRDSIVDAIKIGCYKDVENTPLIKEYQ